MDYKKNMNTLAHKVAMNEGKKQELTIAQIKEVIRIMALILFSDVEFLWKFLKYGREVKRQEEKRWSKCE